MSKESDFAYSAKKQQVGYARSLLDRAVARPRVLLRRLVIGDAIAERPEITLPRDQRRRR